MQFWMMNIVRNSNLGLYFFPFKCCVSQLSVDRFGKNFEAVMTLGQVKSSLNFCSFGPQRAEKRNIWRRKNRNLNLNSGPWWWKPSSSKAFWTAGLSLALRYEYQMAVRTFSLKLQYGRWNLNVLKADVWKYACVILFYSHMRPRTAPPPQAEVQQQQQQVQQQQDQQQHSDGSARRARTTLSMANDGSVMMPILKGTICNGKPGPNG